MQPQPLVYLEMPLVWFDGLCSGQLGCRDLHYRGCTTTKLHRHGLQRYQEARHVGRVRDRESRCQVRLAHSNGCFEPSECRLAVPLSTFIIFDCH